MLFLGFVTVYDFRRTVYLYLGISMAHADLLFRSIGYAENGFIDYLTWLRNIDGGSCTDLSQHYQAKVRDAIDGKGEANEPRIAALRRQLLSESAIQKRGSHSPKLLEMDRFKHRLRETEEMKTRLTLKNHVADVRRAELETELRAADLVLQDREYTRRLANRAEESEAMAAHSALHQQFAAAMEAPPDSPAAVSRDAMQRDMRMLESHLNELNMEKSHLDHRAHDDRMRRLQTMPHVAYPHVAGSHAHALYAGGIAALPPHSWLEASPVTRELLVTYVPALKLDEPKMAALKSELESLKKMNPAETIATLQRLNITSTEKLQLFRDLNLEAIEGVHPGGMLAHAKAGLPIHPSEAEAQLVEQIRASPAADLEKVMMIRDLPLAPSKKIELLAELKVH
jgi:hypothetical protein